MSDIARILGEFVAAWNAGRRPRLSDYLARAPPAERDALADQIETFVLVAPEPAYDEATWHAMTAEPGLARVAAAAMEPEPWPTLLPRLRARAGLSLGDMARRLGLAAAHRTRVEQLLARMESGELDPRRPTAALLERLATILGVSASTLDWRGGPPPAPAAALYRSTTGSPEAERLDLLADALLADAGEWDEVDELFLGGRE